MQLMHALLVALLHSVWPATEGGADPAAAPPAAPAITTEPAAAPAGPPADFAAFMPADTVAALTIEAAPLKKHFRRHLPDLMRAFDYVDGDLPEGEEGVAALNAQADELFDEMNAWVGDQVRQAAEWLGGDAAALVAYGRAIERVHVGAQGTGPVLAVGLAVVIEGPSAEAHRALLAALRAAGERPVGDPGLGVPPRPGSRWTTMREGGDEIHTAMVDGLCLLSQGPGMVAFVIRGRSMLVTNALDIARAAARAADAAEGGARPETFADALARHGIPGPAADPAARPTVWFYLDGARALPYTRVFLNGDLFTGGMQAYDWMDLHYDLSAWGATVVTFAGEELAWRQFLAKPTPWRDWSRACADARHVPFIPPEEEVALAANWAGADLDRLLAAWTANDALMKKLQGRVDEPPAFGRRWPFAAALAEYLLAPPPVEETFDGEAGATEGDEGEIPEFALPDIPLMDWPAWMAPTLSSMAGRLAEVGVVVEKGILRGGRGLAPGLVFCLRFKDAEALRATYGEWRAHPSLAGADGLPAWTASTTAAPVACTVALPGLWNARWDVAHAGEVMLVGVAPAAARADAVGPARRLAARLGEKARLPAGTAGAVYVDAGAMAECVPPWMEAMEAFDVEHLRPRPYRVALAGDGASATLRLPVAEVEALAGTVTPWLAAFDALEARDDRIADVNNARMQALLEALRAQAQQGAWPVELPPAPDGMTWTNFQTGEPFNYRPDKLQRDDKGEVKPDAVVVSTPAAGGGYFWIGGDGERWLTRMWNGGVGRMSRDQLIQHFNPPAAQNPADADVPPPGDVF